VYKKIVKLWLDSIDRERYTHLFADSLDNVRHVVEVNKSQKT